jgi:hypothetical protein
VRRLLALPWLTVLVLFSRVGMWAIECTVADAFVAHGSDPFRATTALSFVPGRCREPVGGSISGPQAGGRALLGAGHARAVAQGGGAGT